MSAPLQSQWNAHGRHLVDALAPQGGSRLNTAQARKKARRGGDMLSVAIASIE
ncbi:hypothetical protein LIG30_0821 [Burkholderia sp. lig30]|jgi:hypothetical protein|uniref:hypothetical protein n=1 Tax=Burkholderia sp. lig30 TaxID=1192124 RepID=UPI00046129C3|nr:hypothetical protein [Burkholderia sp. lig30]KDB10292.1 hypothetical protein LIG30_0821 [Burkholderia sp. lig30]